jgi:hypothetical protein
MIGRVWLIGLSTSAMFFLGAVLLFSNLNAQIANGRQPENSYLVAGKNSPTPTPTPTCHPDIDKCDAPSSPRS